MILNSKEKVFLKYIRCALFEVSPCFPSLQEKYLKCLECSISKNKNKIKINSIQPEFQDRGNEPFFSHAWQTASILLNWNKLKRCANCYLQQKRYFLCFLLALMNGLQEAVIYNSFCCYCCCCCYFFVLLIFADSTE